MAGTVVGIALAGEAFGLTQALGMLLVLGGIVLGQPAVAARLSFRRTPAAPVSDAVPALARAA